MQTVGELCNSLSLFGGSVVDRLVIQSSDKSIDDLSAPLSSVGLVGNTIVEVTYRSGSTLVSPSRYDSAQSTFDTAAQQNVFKYVDVTFHRAPFGLELEVRCVVSTSLACIAGFRSFVTS